MIPSNWPTVLSPLIVNSCICVSSWMLRRLWVSVSMVWLLQMWTIVNRIRVVMAASVLAYRTLTHVCARLGSPDVTASAVICHSTFVVQVLPVFISFIVAVLCFDKRFFTIIILLLNNCNHIGYPWTVLTCTRLSCWSGCGDVDQRLRHRRSTELPDDAELHTSVGLRRQREP